MAKSRNKGTATQRLQALSGPKGYPDTALALRRRSIRLMETVQAGKLVARLERVAHGQEDMTATQLGAARLLLNKLVPDLKSIEHKTDSESDPYAVSTERLLRVIEGSAQRVDPEQKSEPTHDSEPVHDSAPATPVRPTGGVPCTQEQSPTQNIPTQNIPRPKEPEHKSVSPYKDELRSIQREIAATQELPPCPEGKAFQMSASGMSFAVVDREDGMVLDERGVILETDDE